MLAVGNVQDDMMFCRERLMCFGRVEMCSVIYSGLVVHDMIYKEGEYWDRRELSGMQHCEAESR